MSNRSIVGRIARAFEVFGAANRVAHAWESGRTPAPRDLQRLGISAAAFGGIHRA